MQLSNEAVNLLIRALEQSGVFATKSEVDKMAADLVKRHAGRDSAPALSISTVIRGQLAMRGQAINEKTRETDINYVSKALSTGSTPGSYLVPTIQAQEIIQYLSVNGILRASGARVWPLDGIQKLTVPVASGLPTVQYLGQNTAQTASDPNLGQMSFDLKTRRALTVFPNELLATSSPVVDSILTELLGIALAEQEDSAFFGTTSIAGGPTCLMQASGISVINAAGGSANGGNLAYTDLTAILAKAAAVKAKGPFAWFMSPRTFWQRVVGLTDGYSRPIFTGSLQDPVNLRLFGAPVFVTPFLAENESVGSGSNQSHLVYTNPRYLHVADGNHFEITLSTDRYFEANQTAIRGVHRHDFGVGPAAGVVVCQGVN